MEEVILRPIMNNKCSNVEKNVKFLIAHLNSAYPSHAAYNIKYKRLIEIFSLRKNNVDIKESYKL